MKKIFLLFAGVALAMMSAQAQQTWDVGSPNATDVIATLDNGVMTISGTGAMEDFAWYNQPWASARGQITSVVIEDGVTSIGGYAFYECTGLTEVTIPNNVTSIGNYAFYNCTGLTSVTIPNSVTSIGNGAFQACEGLTSVTIGNSVTSIGPSAFQGCTSLTTINVAADNPNYTSEGEVLFNKDKTTLVIYPGGKQGAYTIPNSVTIIDAGAFRDCTGLTEVIIGNSVITIGSSAFGGCTGLTSVTIGNGVTWISRINFNGCTSLTAINVATDNPNYTSEDGVLFNKDKTTLVMYPLGRQGAYTIPNSVTSIDAGAFYNCTNLTSVTIPNSVTSIGWEAFWNCTGLTSITVGWSTPLSINSNVFQNVPVQNVQLFVPSGTENAYLAAPVWNGFGSIEAVSTNSNLLSLQVSNGTLSPEFNAATTGYTLTVPHSVSSLTITATAESTHATVEDTGEKTLEVGDNNIFEIVVTAQDGSTTTTYTITVTRQAAGENPNPQDPSTSVTATAHSPLRLYPNPTTTGELRVENKEWSAGKAIEIYAMSGALVATHPATGEVTTINLSHLPGGTYVLRVGRYTGKFVKQ